MKMALIALVLATAPALPLAVTSAQAQTATQTVTPPSRMGRWEEFRQRQEQISQRNARLALDGRTSAQGAPAGYENKQATLADFADCVVAQAPERVSNFMATTPNSPEETKNARGFASLSSCTRGRAFVSARTGEMRGALAEVLLKREAAKLSALAARSAAVPARIAERAAGTRPFVIAYGQCIAAAAPAQAVSLIATPHGSDDEKRAVMAMGEPLRACMPEGVAYSLNIRDVRNHVADALYRMSETPNA